MWKIKADLTIYGDFYKAGIALKGCLTELNNEVANIRNKVSELLGEYSTDDADSYKKSIEEAIIIINEFSSNLERYGQYVNAVFRAYMSIESSYNFPIYYNYVSGGD